MKRRPGYSPEVQERAFRLVLTTEHEHSSRWAATQSVATKIGCILETLRTWINKIEVDSGTKPGVTSYHAQRKLRDSDKTVSDQPSANQSVICESNTFLCVTNCFGFKLMKLAVKEGKKVELYWMGFKLN